MRLLELDTEQWRVERGQRPMAVRHRLLDDPRLEPEAVARLAGELPHASVEHNRGDVPAVLPGGEAPRVDADPAEVARNIEALGCWMVLKNIEQSPPYKALLDSLLDEVSTELGTAEGGMRQREGFIFLSARGSVTPAHLDSEHNFLLQIRGSKDMTVGSFPDLDTEQRELERKYHGGHRNLDDLPDDPVTFRLDPGLGVYVPPRAPHWVKNGEQLSVSLSITFRTPETDRAELVHAFNGHLRRLGLNPRPPGRSLAADRAKAATLRVRSRLQRRSP